MKASKFSDAQKAFILKQGTDGAGGGRLPQGRYLPSDLLQLEEEVRRARRLQPPKDILRHPGFRCIVTVLQP
jgi:hypothetical protein